MNLQETLEQALKDIQPMLMASGRSIALKESSESGCVIELTGFCSGCACGDSYKEGIEEVIRERVPGIQTIEFVMS